MDPGGALVVLRLVPLVREWAVPLLVHRVPQVRRPVLRRLAATDPLRLVLPQFRTDRPILRRRSGRRVIRGNYSLLGLPGWRWEQLGLRCGSTVCFFFFSSPFPFLYLYVDYDECDG